jgi:tetratricopeptide (TPR) repeat protein
MGSTDQPGASEPWRPRTVLDHQIRDVRKETLQEFTEYAERFARDHGEPGTLSQRHLQRLVAGQGPNGRPLGKPRPATARLLERIFGMPIDVLLSPYVPGDNQAELDTKEQEFRARLRTSARVDTGVIEVLRQQLNLIRRLDRQLGARAVQAEVAAKVQQATELMQHSTMPSTRARLAALLCELCTLAGWQALDRAQMATAWRYYEQAKAAARESGDKSFEAHATAEQAFVLIDMGETQDAVEMLERVRKDARRYAPRILTSWLAAACGEAYAADHCCVAALRAFDDAGELLCPQPHDVAGPHVTLDEVHLKRWRGHALARLGSIEAIVVLKDCLSRLDQTFARAHASLQVDLAIAMKGNNIDARRQYERASVLVNELGSARQWRRLASMV